MSASEHDKVKRVSDDLKATAAQTDAAPPPAPAKPRHERDPKAPRPRVVLGTIIALAMVLLAGSFVVVVATIPAPKPKEPNQVTPAVNVSVMPIEPVRDFIDAFTTPGSVEPNSVVRVAAEVPGRIERVIGVEGRPVKAGDRLIELNTDLLQASLDQARSAMELDARELDRVRNLQQRGSATSTELDQARSRAEVSKAAYDAAKAQLDRAVIFAPSTGTLDKLPVEKGEYVSPGKVVAEIVETDPAIVAVDVPERDMRYIRVGQEETIVADALDGREFTGTVHYISAVADASSRTTRVELRAANPDGELRSGQLVTVNMRRRIIPEAIMIPLGSVISLENGYRVYVVEDGRARPRDVKLGLFKGRDVQITKGLSAGDQLIIRGHYYVGPGQAVKIIGTGDAIEPSTQPATQPAAQPASRPAGGDVK